VTTRRREEIDAMTRLLTEPGRTLAREELAEIESGGMRVRLAERVRTRTVPRKLALLLALEAVEWKMAGSVALGSPALWCGWFSMLVFPQGSPASLRLQPAPGRSYRLEVASGSEAPASESGIGEASEALRRELEARLGASVAVWEV
jgi:hypothetical protein